ncbi:hypothetical protein AAC691_06930 [Nguyenibacter vanlangensis]|uniref:HPP family protein n=1 Tax=Nguyenibacter vanlangensis TaxID=1216886 RepID=A0ABZ3D9K6_9PROT
MFGITPVGWIHTLGSLPAIPLAGYMFVRHGRIVPRSAPGVAYLVAMLTGAVTAFLVAKQPVSYGFGAVTILLLLAGYGVGHMPIFGRSGRYLEAIFLTMTVFLLMLPAATETLRRVPDGHPLVTDPHAPLLVGTQSGLLICLVIGLTVQIISLRRQARDVAHANHEAVIAE